MADRPGFEASRGHTSGVDPIRPVATGSYQEAQLSYFFAELTPRTHCRTKVEFCDNTPEWKPSLAGVLLVKVGAEAVV